MNPRTLQALPQVERMIVMRLRRARAFTHAPHGDREEWDDRGTA